MSLPRVERQRFHRANSHQRLNKERSLGALRSVDGIGLLCRYTGSITMIQSTMSAQNANTTAVSVGLKKNITGRKKISIVESSTVPKSWPVRNCRIFHLAHVAGDEADRVRSKKSIGRLSTFSKM